MALAGVGGKGGAPVAEMLLEAPSRLYESLTVAEQQDLYDRAAWDMLDWLNGLTAETRAKEFKRQEWVDRWKPEPSTFCSTCGSYALEMKFSDTHIKWQCLEETCRKEWEWKAS